MATGSIGDRLASPLTVGLAAAGAVVGFLLGGIPGAVGLAIVAAGARLAAAARQPRMPARPRIDPFALGDPWKRLVQDAVQAQNRFADIVRNTRPGPLRERLDDIGTRIADGVEEAWEVGRSGHALADARHRIDVAGLRRRLDHGDAGLEGTARSLQSQLDSAARLDDTIKGTQDRLRLTTTHLDEAVARAAELAARVGDTSELERLGSDVELLVHDLEALRQGLDEVNRPSTGTG